MRLGDGAAFTGRTRARCRTRVRKGMAAHVRLQSAIGGQARSCRSRRGATTPCGRAGLVASRHGPQGGHLHHAGVALRAAIREVLQDTSIVHVVTGALPSQMTQRNSDNQGLHPALLRRPPAGAGRRAGSHPGPLSRSADAVSEHRHNQALETKAQVGTGMQVHRRAVRRQGHGGALGVPAGPARPPRAGPGGITGLAALPHGLVQRVTLGRVVGPAVGASSTATAPPRACLRRPVSGRVRRR